MDKKPDVSFTLRKEWLIKVLNRKYREEYNRTTKQVYRLNSIPFLTKSKYILKIFQAKLLLHLPLCLEKLRSWAICQKH